MPEECYVAQCQQERRFMRRELNKWTKNLLLQTGLETIATNYFEFEINSFNQRKDEENILLDFNPNEKCLFCINRQEYFSNKSLHQSKQHFSSNGETDPIVHDNENSPLDLSLKSTSNLNSHSLFDIQSDNLPEELLLSSRMNFDYFSQSLSNVNLFSTFPINQYPFNSALAENYVTQLAKHMAYLRMIQEIDNQRHDRKLKVTMKSPNTSSILTESMYVNQIINDIMTRTLKDIFQEQIKRPTRGSKQEELLLVKKQNNEKDDLTIWKRNKQQQKHNNHVHPSPSSSSSTSSVSSRCSPLIHRQNKQNSQSSARTSRRRARDILSNSKVIIGTNGKQIRPKRGQYRRYESEQLAKAVAAVLSNEMSVHRAGSHFGVPHSTLEYKVKERNSKMSGITKTDFSPCTSVIENHVSNDYDAGVEIDRLSSYAQSKNGKNIQMNNCEHSIDDETKSDAEDLQSHHPIALAIN